MADLRRIRRVRSESFTTINNTILRDDSISLKAKGVMVTVMGLPDDWDFSVAGLVSIVKEGKAAIYAAIKELKKAGYVRVDRIYKNGKVVAWEYVFTETNQAENLLTDFQEVENLDVENRTQLKKQLIKEISNQGNRHTCALENSDSWLIKKIFQKHFGFPLSTSLSKTILPAVTDLPAWERTVLFWTGNSYRPSKKMLDYYHEELADDPRGAHFATFR